MLIGKVEKYGVEKCYFVCLFYFLRIAVLECTMKRKIPFTYSKIRYFPVVVKF